MVREASLTGNKGVNLLFVDAVFWVLIFLTLNILLENVFRSNLDRLSFGFFSVLPGLWIAFRIKIGGKYSAKEKIAYPLILIGIIMLFLYAIGFNFQTTPTF